MNHGNTKSAVRKTQLMRGKGITYDTGFFYAGVSTRETFDPEVVKRDMMYNERKSKGTYEYHRTENYRGFR